MIRVRLFILMAILVAASGPAPVAAAEPARDEMDDIGTIRGPIADFWLKVRSEWSGYLRSDGGPTPDGGGPMRQRVLINPPPNRVWVSLVYGDMFGPRHSQPLAHLFDEFITEWKQAEGRNWPYAQIFDRPWEKMGQIGRTQNIIMIGTPWSLPPVKPLAESLGFNISPGRIDIGKRKFRGENLILIFIAPNPYNPEKYALVITGTNDEGLMQAGHLPYGDTDYVLFRGRRTLESGAFAKDVKSTSWGPPQTFKASGTHRGFSIRESAHYTFWYEPDRLPREQLDALVASKEASYASLIARVPPANSAIPPRIVYYLYPSVDRKIDETARDEIVHVDLATGEIHTVYSRLERVVEPYLDLQVLLHRSIGPTRVPQLERALAIAMAPEFQGRDIGPIAGRFLHDVDGRESAVLKALRDQDVITPADGPPSPHDIMLAGFLKDLVRRHGRERAFEFVARASPGRLDDAFENVYPRDLSDALHDWSDSVKVTSAAGPPAKPGLPAGTPPSPADALVTSGIGRMRLRDDAGAARLFEEALQHRAADPRALAALARLRFRHGDFDAAEKRAGEAIAACGTRSTFSTECAEAEAWSRLTLGRIEALRGRYVTARLELTHPAVKGGPAPVPTLADYWLFTMGDSRNQLTIVSHLKREARVSLRNLDWREAEAGLKRALEIDPTDGEAHRLLSEVYHKEHEYWSWQIRYLNEIHPDYNVLSRIYLPREMAPFAARVEPLHTIDSFNDLVLRGNLELLKAQTLYAAEIQNLHAEGDRYLLERRDMREALKMYRRALELNSDFFLSHFLVGRCYFLMDRYDDARRSFEEALKRKPTDRLVLAWTNTYLGYISLAKEDLPGARRSFERALSQADQGKVGTLAREGLGKVDTIRLLAPKGSERQ